MSPDRIGEPSQCPPDGTFVTGRYGIIEAVDAGACRLLGYTEDELVGLHGSELIPHAERPTTAVSLDRMRRGELPERVGHVPRKDGEVLVFDVSARRLPDGRIALDLRQRAMESSDCRT